MMMKMGDLASGGDEQILLFPNVIVLIPAPPYNTNWGEPAVVVWGDLVDGAMLENITRSKQCRYSF